MAQKSPTAVVLCCSSQVTASNDPLNHSPLIPRNSEKYIEAYHQTSTLQSRNLAGKHTVQQQQQQQQLSSSRCLPRSKKGDLNKTVPQHKAAKIARSDWGIALITWNE